MYFCTNFRSVFYTICTAVFLFSPAQPDCSNIQPPREIKSSLLHTKAQIFTNCLWLVLFDFSITFPAKETNRKQGETKRRLSPPLGKSFNFYLNRNLLGELLIICVALCGYVYNDFVCSFLCLLPFLEGNYALLGNGQVL